MSNVIYMAADGVYEMIPGEKPRRITGELKIKELPPGDWRMTICKGKVIIADASGQNPVMVVDKEGNWETLPPLPRPLTDEEKSEMYYHSNGCYSHIYGDPQLNGGDDA